MFKNGGGSESELKEIIESLESSNFDVTVIKSLKFLPEKSLQGECTVGIIMSRVRKNLAMSQHTVYRPAEILLIIHWSD